MNKAVASKFPTRTHSFRDLARRVSHAPDSEVTRSPDHADAGIWALTELMLEVMPGENLFAYYAGLKAEKAAAEEALNLVL